MKRASTVFSKQIPIAKALLIGIGVLVALCFLFALTWKPLLREMGYAKTSEITPEDTTRPGANALNPTPSEPTPPPVNTDINRNIDLGQLYDSIQVGKDQDHLVQTATVAPSNCATFQVPTLGAETICTWINGDKAVLFTILNGKILAKSKYNF